MAAVHVVQSRTFTPQIRSRSARALRESKRSLHARVLILLRVNKILFAARQPAPRSFAARSLLRSRVAGQAAAHTAGGGQKYRRSGTEHPDG